MRQQQRLEGRRLDADGSGGGTSEASIVAAALLRATDVPGDEKGAVSSETEDVLPKDAGRVPECRRYVDAVRKGAHHRASNRFVDTSSRPPVAVSDAVEVYPSPSVVAGQAELFKDPATSTCLEGVLRIELGKELSSVGATLGAVHVTPLEPPALGDHAFALRVSVTITQLGQQLELVRDQIGVGVGRYAVTLDVGLSTPEALTPTARDQLLGRMTQVEQAVGPKVVDRMRAAGA